MQLSPCQQRSYLLGGEAKRQQLCVGDHSVLPERQRSETWVVWMLLTNVETTHPSKIPAIASHVGHGMHQLCNKKGGPGTPGPPVSPTLS
jgi:hypothetical protein